MSTIERDVARHYAHAALESIILRGLEAMGRHPSEVMADDLAAIDEFHMGGRQATADLADQMELRPGQSILDVGCGLGGTPRFLARRHRCQVTGIDLTPDYVAAGRALTRLVGLQDQVEHQVGSALDMPFPDGAFDAATLLHVGMNISDKRRLAAEVARVVKVDGTFAIYDVMRVGEGDIVYPVAWAATPATSFVETPKVYRQALAAAGFEVITERSRGLFALQVFREMRTKVAEHGLPPLGLHILMGADASTKVANLIANLEAGRIAPVEMIARRRPDV